MALFFSQKFVLCLRNNEGYYNCYLDNILKSRIIQIMKTVLETETFKKQADKIWSESERLEFIVYLSANPGAGDVVPHADGARKYVGLQAVLASVVVLGLFILILMPM